MGSMRGNFNDNRKHPSTDWSPLVYGAVFFIGVAVAIGIGWLFH